jgi:hypothetical protein
MVIQAAKGLWQDIVKAKTDTRFQMDLPRIGSNRKRSSCSNEQTSNNKTPKKTN